MPATQSTSSTATSETMLLAGYSDAVLLLDASCRVVTWNKAFELIYGSSRPLSAGCAFFTVFPKAVRTPALTLALKQALEGNDTTFTGSDEDGFFSNSSEIHFTVLKDSSNTNARLLCIRRTPAALPAPPQQGQDPDLAVQLRAAREMNKMVTRRLFEQMNRVDQLAAILMEREHTNFTEAGKNYCGRIRQLIQATKNLAEELLAYISLDDEQLTIVPVDLNLLFRFIKDTIRDEITHKQAAIDCSWLPVVQGDRQLLYRFFVELIRNGLKYHHPDTPPYIRVTATVLTPDAPAAPVYYQISIADNGPGIDARHMERLFDPLYKAPAGNRHVRGNGLGLAVCRKIAEMLGGTIRLTSEPGAGTVAICSLPASIDKVAQDGATRF